MILNFEICDRDQLQKSFLNIFSQLIVKCLIAVAIFYTNNVAGLHFVGVVESHWRTQYEYEHKLTLKTKAFVRVFECGLSTKIINYISYRFCFRFNTFPCEFTTFLTKHLLHRFQHWYVNKASFCVHASILELLTAQLRNCMLHIFEADRGPRAAALLPKRCFKIKKSEINENENF